MNGPSFGASTGVAVFGSGAVGIWPVMAFGRADSAPRGLPAEATGFRAMSGSLSGGEGSIAPLRRFLRCLLHEFDPDVQETAVLLADEVATNAVVHGGGSFDLHYELWDGRLAVDVADRGDGTPTVREPGATQEHGRGLALVAALSADWGVLPLVQGKRVWFHMDLPGSRAG